MVSENRISKMGFRRVFDRSFVLLTTSTQTTASDCSPFNSASDTDWHQVLKRAELGDNQGRTVTSDVIFRLFFVQPSSCLRIFFATAFHSQNPIRHSSIQFCVLYKTACMPDLSNASKCRETPQNSILTRGVTFRSVSASLSELNDHPKCSVSLI